MVSPCPGCKLHLPLHPKSVADSLKQLKTTLWEMQASAIPKQGLPNDQFSIGGASLSQNQPPNQTKPNPNQPKPNRPTTLHACRGAAWGVRSPGFQRACDFVQWDHGGGGTNQIYIYHIYISTPYLLYLLPQIYIHICIYVWYHMYLFIFVSAHIIR